MTLTATGWLLGPVAIALTCDGSSCAIIAAVGHLGIILVGSIVSGSGGEWHTSWLWACTCVRHNDLCL